MKCQKCGYENSDTDKFCVNCGEALEARVEPKLIYCPNCGAANDDGGRFCKNCGCDMANPQQTTTTQTRVRATSSSKNLTKKIIPVLLVVAVVLGGGYAYKTYTSKTKYPMYAKYYDALVALEDEYGEGVIEEDYDDDGDYEYLDGVFFATLLDFNHDGSMDMLVYYNDPYNEYASDYSAIIYTYDEENKEVISYEYDHGDDDCEIYVNFTDNGERMIRILKNGNYYYLAGGSVEYEYYLINEVNDYGELEEIEYYEDDEYEDMNYDIYKDYLWLSEDEDSTSLNKTLKTVSSTKKELKKYM